MIINPQWETDKFFKLVVEYDGLQTWIHVNVLRLLLIHTYATPIRKRPLFWYYFVINVYFIKCVQKLKKVFLYNGVNEYNVSL